MMRNCRLRRPTASAIHWQSTAAMRGAFKEEFGMRISRFTLNSDASATPRLGVASDDGIRDVTAASEALPALRWPLPRGDQMIANLATLGPKMKELAAHPHPFLPVRGRGLAPAGPV